MKLYKLHNGNHIGLSQITRIRVVPTPLAHCLACHTVLVVLQDGCCEESQFEDCALAKAESDKLAKLVNGTESTKTTRRDELAAQFLPGVRDCFHRREDPKVAVRHAFLLADEFLQQAT